MRRRVVPLIGVVFFLTLLTSRLLGKSAPDSEANGSKVLAFYTNKHSLMVASATVLVIAIAAGVIFYGLLSDYLRHDDRARGPAATGFGGALLFLCGAVVVAGATIAMTDHTRDLQPATAQTLNLVRWDVQEAFLAAGAAIMLFSYGIAIVSSRLLPRWLGWLAFPLALAALIPPLTTVLASVAAIWTLIVSIALFLRSPAAEPGTTGVTTA